MAKVIGQEPPKLAVLAGDGDSAARDQPDAGGDTRITRAAW
jgi:hypothetical protein